MIDKIIILVICIASSLFANPFSFADKNISKTHFSFEGNTVFSDEQLQIFVDKNKDMPLGYDSIESVRLDISKAYIDAGYISSGATIPMQDFSKGDVLVHITEGKLSHIEIIESGTLNDEYILNKLEYLKNTILHTKQLRDALSLLKFDSMIDKVDAKLVPTKVMGSAKLTLDIQTAQQLEIIFGINNHRSPSIGSLNSALSLTHKNLFGNAEKLDMSVGLTRSADKIDDSDGAVDYNIKFTLPINSLDLEWFVSASEGVSAVIIEPLAELDIVSTTTAYESGLNYLIYQTLRSKIETSLSYGYKDIYATLLGEKFSLGRGSIDGGYNISALQWTLSSLTRSESFVSYVKATLRQGLDKGDLASDLPNSAFTTMILDYYHLIPFENNKANVVFKFHAQFASEELLFSEKVTIGGVNSVRGFREGSKSGDNGLYTTLEYKRSINDLVFSSSKWIPSLVVFGDYGMVEDIFTKQDSALYSAGGGLKWKTDIFSFDIYLAHALSEKPIYQGSDWQDDGLHFNFSAKLY